MITVIKNEAGGFNAAFQYYSDGQEYFKNCPKGYTIETMRIEYFLKTFNGV